MQKRRLGDTDLELTAIGLGTWAIGGGDWLFGWGPQDEEQAVAAVLRGVELGVNWIDTAAVYGGGRSEELVGRALRELGARARPIVATKCTRLLGPGGKPYACMKRDSLIAECEGSLRRLGVDTIDLYQLHWPQPEADLEEGWATLVELKEQGKVRHIGVSNFRVGELERAEAIHPVASLQPPYSMIARDVERELLPFCAEHRIGVVAYSPMGKGLLTGAFTPARAAALGEDDHRSRDPNFAEPRLGIHLELVEALRPIATARGQSLAELAIAWVLRRPEVTSAIVGVRRPDQVEAIGRAADSPLTSDETANIERRLAARDEALRAV